MSNEEVQSSEPTPEEMFDNVSETDTPQATEEGTPAPEETKERMFEYEALGATRNEPESLVLKRASQGYDYAQKMEALKQQTAELEQRQADADARYQKYAHLDDYARENPEWHEHWTNAYDQRGVSDQMTEGQQPQVDLSPIKSEIDSLRNDFAGVKDFVNKQQQSQEDGKYWDEVKAVQSEFPDVDLNQSDETGKTLEFKILEHAKSNDIPSFRVAFRDFYHDNLKTRMLEQAKQDLIKADKENRKKGIVGVSNTPMLSSDAPDYRNMSSHELEEAAIAEFNRME